MCDSVAHMWLVAAYGIAHRTLSSPWAVLTKLNTGALRSNNVPWRFLDSVLSTGQFATEVNTDTGTVNCENFSG